MYKLKAVGLILLVFLVATVGAVKSFAPMPSEYKLVKEFYDQPGLWAQIPYGQYTNTFNPLGVPQEANKAVVLRYWNDRDVVIRHLCFYNGHPTAGVKVRMALYSSDGQTLLMDTGVIDASSTGPLGNGNIIIDLPTCLKYESGYYFVWQACNSASFTALGILPGTEYNQPIVNGGKLPTVLDSDLTPPPSFDPTTILKSGGYHWAFAGQS
jgi:hypothetical protein